MEASGMENNMTPKEMEEWISGYISEEARQREALHKGQASSRPLSDDYEAVGLFGEFKFGAFSGIMPNLQPKPEGDSGIDFVMLMRFTLDVKTARKPKNLIHEKGKKFVDIYVLASYEEDKSVKLLGWEWGAKLRKAPTKDFGYGVINHYIPAEKLRPMEELESKMVKFS